MNKKKKKLLSIGIMVLLTFSGIVALYIFASEYRNPVPAVRVACVGDSLTQSSWYPTDLSEVLGTGKYLVSNFGAGSTTILLSSETPYMNNTRFRSALEFAPNVVIIMLGTNDAQPSLFHHNTSFVGDYLTLVNAFQVLPSKPKIWVVLPPPIFSNKSGAISPEYFTNTIVPLIKQAASQANLPTINVYSALEGYSIDFPDGIHPNKDASQIIANTIYKAIISNNTAAMASKKGG